MSRLLVPHSPAQENHGYLLTPVVQWCKVMIELLDQGAVTKEEDRLEIPQVWVPLPEP